jgi:deazaflavin-dependent oxidoreductase (nitroreductase family)
MPEWNEKIIEEFRVNGGRVGGPFEGAPLTLLTTVGARSGERRTNPVGYLRDGGRILVFASNAGAPAHPAWYHNLLAEPRVTVEVGDGTDIETYAATAHVLRGEERRRLYARQARISPAFTEYAERTTREIPVVALYRTDPARLRALGDELVRIHRGLRQELAELLASVDDHVAGQQPAAWPPALDRRLSERCLSFCQAVHDHHSNETGRGFPLLEERFPGLAPVLERLRQEHDVLAGLRDRFQSTLSGAGRPGEVRAELRGLAAEMEAHFDREERQLVPALNAL